MPSFSVTYLRRTGDKRYPECLPGPQTDVLADALREIDKPFAQGVFEGSVEALCDEPEWAALGFPCLGVSRRALEVACRKRGGDVKVYRRVISSLRRLEEPFHAA